MSAIGKRGGLVRGRVAHVLATLAESSDVVAARRRVYAEVDPLVRGVVRRHVEAAAARAQLEDPADGDQAHVHRLAYLAVRGIDDGAHLGVEETKARFEHARAADSVPSRFGATTTLCAVGLIALAMLGALGYLLTRPPVALRDAAPERNDAWREGGRPRAGSPEVRALFAETLPGWVVALDAWRAARERGDGSRERARVDGETAALLDRSRELLGADLTSFVHAVLDQATALVGDDEAPAADSHLRSVDALVGALADRGLGYYVDAEVFTRRASGPGRNRVYLSTFTVENVAFYRSGAREIRVLRLRRLDRLAVGRAVLGFTREQIGDALVLEERVETHLVDYVLPSLAEGARMPLVDDGPGSVGPWVEQLERAAGGDARATALAISADSPVVAELLARRKQLVERWQARFTDLVVARPSGFDFEPDAYRAIERRVPRTEWYELEAIASGLRDEAPRRAYGALEDAFTRSIERHEAQHRLDFVEGTLMQPSAALTERVGAVVREDGTRNDRAFARLAELSAYLSEIARAPELVRVNLALFGRHLFARRGWGTAESTSILILYESLAAQLGIDSPPLTVARRVDREALAGLHLRLRALPPEDVAAAAKRAWEELFARPLPPLTRR